MFVHRRIALVCAIGALAVSPGTALAMPATDPPAPPKSAPAVAPVETVAPVDSGSDTTLALVFSGSALLVAAGAMALSGYDHRQLGKVA
jgi:hypothetical protein